MDDHSLCTGGGFLVIFLEIVWWSCVGEWCVDQACWEDVCDHFALLEERLEFFEDAEDDPIVIVIDDNTKK